MGAEVSANAVAGTSSARHANERYFFTLSPWLNKPYFGFSSDVLNHPRRDSVEELGRLSGARRLSLSLSRARAQQGVTLPGRDNILRSPARPRTVSRVCFKVHVEARLLQSLLFFRWEGRMASISLASVAALQWWPEGWHDQPQGLACSNRTRRLYKPYVWNVQSRRRDWFC